MSFEWCVSAIFSLPVRRSPGVVVQVTNAGVVCC